MAATTVERSARVRLTPRRYRIVTFVALGLLAAIIVTGGAVRVTGSGLGCPDWPTCTDGNLAPQLFSEQAGHATVEYLNRLVTGLVSVVVIVAVLGALVRTPRRRDLTWLAASLVGGVIGQIVLGGVTVLTHLNPIAVQSHFLLSLVIVTFAVVLHERAGWDDAEVSDGRAPERASSEARWSWLATALLVPAIIAGTVLTGTGPHGGDPKAQRFALLPGSVARVHGILVELFTTALLVVLVRVWRSGADRRTLTRGSVAVAVAVAQSALGYTQYFTGVPAVLVGLHIFGATALWIAVLRFHLAVLGHAPDPATARLAVNQRRAAPVTAPT